MQTLNEELLSSYLFFGWIDPKGKLILPTVEDKNSPHIVLHADLLDGNINEMFKQGYIRFLIEKKSPKQITYFTKNLEKVNLITFLLGIKEIENLIATNKINPKVFPNPIPLPETHVFEYEKNLKFHKISAYSPQELKRKIEAEKLKMTESFGENTKALEESFGLDLFYSVWGWITPEGELLLPTKEMKDSKEMLFSHEDILPISEYPPNPKNLKKTNEALKMGYIRWFVEVIDPKTLVLSAHKDSIDPNILSIGIEKIEKYLTKRPDEIFPQKPKFVFEYLLDLKGSNYINIRAKTKNELLNKLKKILEESFFEVEAKKLDEYFEMEDWYLAWGWANPKGKLILPTLEMKNHPYRYFRHTALLNNMSTYDALTNGYIRWFIEYSSEHLPKLFLEFRPKFTQYESIVKAIQNIEKFLTKKPDSVFPEKPSEIFKYEAEVSSFPGIFIRSENKNDFLRKIKKYFEKIKNEKTLTEFFGMDGFYLAWGWITPKGELLLPTKEDKESENSVVHLLFLQQYYPKYKSILEALNDGFVRWHIEKEEKFPDLWLTFMPHKIKPEILKKGIDKIETFLKKQPDPIFPRKPEFFDKIQTTFYFYPKKDSEFYKFSSVGQLLSKVKNENSLNEKFLHKNYLAWGIITKNGKLIKPSVKHKNSSDTIIHLDIIPKSEGKYFSISEYIEDGGIRWFIEKDQTGQSILFIDTNKKTDNQKIINAAIKILSDPPDEVFPNKPLEVNQIIVFRDFDEIYAKNLSHLKKILSDNKI